MDRTAQRAEVDRNYDAFSRQLATYLAQHRDDYALMRGGEVIGFFKTVREALTEAGRRFPDGIYSLQEVTDEPIDLGIFSHAGS